MLETTRNAVKAILAADPSVTKAQTANALAALDGAEPTERIGRVLKRKEVAEILRCTPVWVSILGKRGVLRKVGTGSCRSMGYTEESVRAFAGGRR